MNSKVGVVWPWLLLGQGSPRDVNAAERGYMDKTCWKLVVRGTGRRRT